MAITAINLYLKKPKHIKKTGKTMTNQEEECDFICGRAADNPEILKEGLDSFYEEIQSWSLS